MGYVENGLAPPGIAILIMSVNAFLGADVRRVVCQQAVSVTMVQQAVYQGLITVVFVG